jgi:acetyl/propionyl-CoA carboxylase alpha subunit
MTVWLEVEGRKRRVELSTALDGVVECIVDGKAITVDVRLLQPGVMSLLVEGRQYRCVLDGDGVLIGGRRFGFEVSDHRSLQGRRSVGGGAAGPRAVKAPMPGRVVRVLAAVGDEVAEQQGVVVIEAMKMQNELKSPKAGRVVRMAVREGDTVGAGDVLAVVE